jgi:hypothetical protein
MIVVIVQEHRTGASNAFAQPELFRPPDIWNRVRGRVALPTGIRGYGAAEALSFCFG